MSHQLLHYKYCAFVNATHLFAITPMYTINRLAFVAWRNVFFLGQEKFFHTSLHGQ